MVENVRALLAALVASLGAFLFGLDIGYIAPILECPSFKRDVAHHPDWADPNSKIDSSTAGFMVGIFSLGCVVSASPVVSGYFLDKWGRRGSIIVGSMIFLAGDVFQARAMSVAVMLVGRLVTGFSIGLLSTVVPLYQAEMAPASMRGAFTTLYQLMVTLGIFVAALVDFVVVDWDGGWRLAIWLQAIPAALILAAMPLLPRSPRWLVQQGRREEAQAVLLSLRPKDQAREELEEIVAENQASQQLGEPKWSQVLSGRVGRLVALGIVLQLLQNLVGINAFMYFGPRIFASFGLSANLFQTINNGVNLAFTLPALYLADRAGRRILFIYGAIGMASSCVVMGTLGVLFMTRRGDSWEEPSGGVAGLMAAMVFFFVMNFACTWGPVVWMYCAEIFPLRYRSLCIGLTTMSNWMGNYLVAQFTPVLLDVLGFGTFFVFGFFSLVGLVLSLRLPETKGIGLEHIAEAFDELWGIGNGKGAGAYGAVDAADSRLEKAA